MKLGTWEKVMPGARGDEARNLGKIRVVGLGQMKSTNEVVCQLDCLTNGLK